MADPIDEWPTPIEDPNGIIWLASYPKSGNTWVRAFLHNLFDVQAGVAEGEHDINALTEFSVWEVSAQRFTEILGKSPVEAGPDAVAAIRCQVQQEIADRGPGLHLVKTHNALVVNRGELVPNIAPGRGIRR